MDDFKLSNKDLRKMKAKDRMRRNRQNIEFKLNETSRNRESKAEKRKNIEVRQAEQTIDAIAHKKARQSVEKRITEQKRDSEAKRMARSEDNYRKNEQQKDTVAHRLVRCNEEKRRKEQLRNTKAHCLSRSVGNYREIEKQRDTKAHRLVRSKVEYRKDEQLRDKNSHRLTRGNEEYRLLEQHRNTEAHKAARLDLDRRTLEKQKDKVLRRQVRSIDERRNIERDEDRISKKISRLEIKENITFEELSLHYTANIKNGPTVVCDSCNGLFFEASIRVVVLNTLINNGINRDFLDKVCKISSEKLGLCISCHRDVKQSKIPALSKANGLLFPDIPTELLGMTELEVRLVSPRIPFMQIRELSKRDKQFGLKGNVVNVPVSVDTSVTILPRTFDDSYTIQLKMKRKMCYQTHYLYETVRPARCYNAVKYLINTPLYQLENITISEDWLNQHSNEIESFVVLDEDKDNNFSTNNVNNIESTCDTENTRIIDGWAEIEDENINTNDTLWTDIDISQTISFAPGEGKFPLSIIRDEFSEELSFPNIYCGIPRQTKNVTYSNICKWELRHVDRRCCNVSKLFFMFKKRQIQQISKQVSINLRKSKNNENITAGQILNKDFVENICKVDDGYKFLKVDRASPPYWQARKKELLAMIRQIGIPTFFVTLSAAETKWKELLVILMKTVRNQTISENDTNDLNYKDKCELISRDPVTCSRYFDKRIRELFHVLNHSKGPFEENIITDTYVRIEFQHRGSPHVHSLLWLKNAPIYNKEHKSTNDCIKFIDKYITANSNFDEQLIDLQTHRHSMSCKKFIGETIACRFDFPQLPMPYTMILEPNDGTEESDAHYELYQRIKQLLAELEKKHKLGLKSLTNTSFQDFLDLLNTNFDMYLVAIRSQLKQPKVFLKRNLKDIRVNCYNKNILQLHNANLDIQFILDAYSCVQYILNYLNKPDRGMSKILNEAVEEVKSGNFSIRDRLKIIGDRYLKATEISAQEAVYHLLSMDLSRSSRAHVFINTGEPKSRNKMVKNEVVLKQLNSDSKDIYQLGDLDYYVLRPDCMSNVCLADFCALYNRYIKRPNIKSKIKMEYNKNDDVLHQEEEIGQIFVLKNNAGYLERRKKAKIIRYRRYSLKTDEHNYYREQCQLFLPWYNEDKDLINTDIEKSYHQNKKEVFINASKYVYVQQDVADFEDRFKEVEDLLKENEDKYEKSGHDYSVYTVDTEATYSLSYDISDSIPKTKMEKYLTPVYKPEEVYRIMMHSLNSKQRKYCMNLLFCMKTKQEPIYNIIIGGAGVGKSCLINAVYQTLIRYYNGVPGSNPETLKILLCAPTGKAAFNINGVTTNSAFDIFNQNHDYKNLSYDRRNTLFSNFIDLKLIIIDEISMVGISQFEQINLRLQDIFCTTKIFGGVSVICFGDFYQLRPVQDYFVFKDNTKNKYGYLFANQLWINFKSFELTEIMRQRDDKKFASALNNLASGTCSTEDLSLFKSREINDVKNNPPKNAINLFRTNVDVDQFNLSSLNRNPEYAYHNRAEDIADGDVSADIKLKALSLVALKKRTETYGLATDIILKEGGNFMVTVNINTEDGIVNGASGVIKKIEAIDNKPYKVWIEFSDVNVGMKTRQRYFYAIKRCGYSNSWTPIEKLTREIPMSNPKFRQNVRIKRTQFPLVSCEAMTINKAQGQSYDEVVVNMSSRDKKLMLSHVYVALSRARNSSGLFINGNFFLPRRTNAVIEVDTEINRLRNEAALTFDLKFLQDQDLIQIKLLYHNVQSLIKNYKDIINDQNYMFADILLLVETWMVEGENIDLPSFNLISQISSKKQRKAFGCAVYSKINCEKLFEFKQSDKKSYFNCVAFNTNNHDILLIYNSVSTAKSDLLDHIDKCLSKVRSEKCIVIGDFNFNIVSEFNQALETFMVRKGFTLSETCVTTNNNTKIDLVFTRGCSISIYPYESYFSYHKAFWFLI